MLRPVWLFLLFALSLHSVFSRDSISVLDRRGPIENPFLSITPTHDLQWSFCYEKNAANKLAGQIGCARLIVPLDYSKGSSGNVELAIIRFKGGGTSDAVFYNPGGPGADPVSDMFSKAALLRAYIGQGPDIVGIVPRGVSATFPPMTCDVTENQAEQRFWEMNDELPDNNEESLFEAYAEGESIGLDCPLVDPDLIRFSGTVSVAHDMDLVRQKLGQDRLSYLGFSYGTALGATYATLFPDRVGRMVLDGVLDLKDYYSWDKNPEYDIGDVDLAFDHFFQACHDAGKADCPIWSKTVQGVRDLLYQADQKLYAVPLPVPGYGLLKWPLFRYGVYSALYSPATGFPLLAGATKEILQGAARQYLEAYMQLVQSAITSASHWPVDSKTGLKNSVNAGSFISCVDSGGPPQRLEKGQLNALFSRYEDVSKFFGGISAQFALLCDGANLSAKSQAPIKFEGINTANPILFVSNTADPTTPIVSGRRMNAAFPGSRLLTINGTGHLSFSAQQDPTRCASKWIEPYFRDGTLPPEGTVCQGMQVAFSS